MELFDESKFENELKIPYSIEAEEALLGSIFIKPDAISEIIEVITPADFYKNNYRIIFEEMLKAYNIGKIIDTLLIVEALKKSYDSLKIKLQNVFGIDLVIEKKSDNSSELTNNLIELLLKLRSDARKERNFKLSDEIRDELKKLGVAIKDNKDGSTSFEIE